MAKKPTDQQFEIAVMWLQGNEGDGGESDACRAVADWIESCRTQDMLRKAARAGGVSVRNLRKRLQDRATVDPEMEN
jgi:hypothetical protein